MPVNFLLRTIIIFVLFIPELYAQECTILLHGMGRSSGSMELIETSLQNKGHIVWNKSYPSTENTISQLANEFITSALTECHSKNAKRINFVTHSMGGILVRYYYQNKQTDQLGRIVMLSPPNHGSEIADLLKENYIYKNWMGPAGQEIGVTQTSLPNQLKPINAEIGIIAGSSTSDPWFSPFIPGEDDGKVSIESAKLEEMTDFLIVDSGHSYIMQEEEVIKQIGNFLDHGKFCH